MKKILVILVIIIAPGCIKAQSKGPLYRQFFFNPYAFNPAYGGMNNQSEVGLIYRKQWVNFQDAPTTAGLTLQLPASRRVVLGVNVLTDKQVLLKNSSFMTSFTYVVPLGFQQSLRFGLSGGIGMNALNLSVEEMSSNDPVITKAVGNNYYLNGNFGAVYSYRNLKVGFALTEIFDSNPFQTERFNKFSFSNLRNRLYSASYRFELPSASAQIAIEPYVIYRESEDGVQNYWEAATLIHFNQVLWTGAAYNQNNGLALFLGLNVKQKFGFSYSYEFPPFNSSNFSASSHELQMNLKFGKELPAVSKPSLMLQKLKRPRPQQFKRPGKPAMKRSRPARSPMRASHQTTNDRQPVAVSSEAVAAPASQSPVASDSSSGKSHYVVVGSFKEKSHADTLVQQLSAQGYAVETMVNPENGNHHVYLPPSADLGAAKKLRDEFKQKHPDADAWILSRDH